MLCCICKAKKATVHLTQIVDNKTQKVDLCDDCAREKGVNDPTGFSLADLLLGLGASQEMAQTSGSTELKCPSCGFTHSDFKKTGRLGCSECYVTFAEGLEGLLKSMHKGTRHVGKVPAGFRQTKTLSDQIKILQKRLDQAVAEEDYEQAAVVRDEIKSIQKKLAELTAS